MTAARSSSQVKENIGQRVRSFILVNCHLDNSTSHRGQLIVEGLEACTNHKVNMTPIHSRCQRFVNSIHKTTDAINANNRQ